MTHVDSHQHCLLGNFWTKVHPPQVSSQFSIDLSEDVNEDAAVVFADGSALDELRDDRIVSVNFVLEGGVEVFLADAVGDDDEEEVEGVLLERFLLLHGLFVGSYFLGVVIINSLLEVLN